MPKRSRFLPVKPAKDMCWAYPKGSVFEAHLYVKLDDEESWLVLCGINTPMMVRIAPESKLTYRACKVCEVLLRAGVQEASRIINQ